MQIITVKDKESGTELDNAIKRGNIMVLIYADWCPHCVSFKPKWEEFKKSMRNKSLCDIGEVEQTYLEHVPSAKPKGFPTIKFYKVPAAHNNTNNHHTQSSNNNQPTTRKTKKAYMVPLGRVPVKHNPFAKMLMERAEAADPENNVINMDMPANNEVDFEGERTISSLTKFANDNATSIMNVSVNAKPKGRKSVKTLKHSSKGKKGVKAQKRGNTSVKKQASKKARVNKKISKKYMEEKSNHDPVVMQELNNIFNNMASSK